MDEDSKWVPARPAGATQFHPLVVLSPRAASAMLLGGLSAGARLGLNRAGTLLQRASGNAVLTEGFGEAPS